MSTGIVQMEIKAEPTVTLQAGQGFLIPFGIPHNATDLGLGTGRMLSTYIVESGKPIVTFTKP